MWRKSTIIAAAILAIALAAGFYGCEKQENPVGNQVNQEQTGENGEETGIEMPEGEELRFTDSSLPEQWNYAVYREVCYALSEQRYNANDWGASNRIINAMGGSWFAGDWNYMGLGYGIGGQCKTFASEIIERATGGAVTLPSGYYYATQSINAVQGGDVIQRLPIYGTPHTAIALGVLEWGPTGNPTKLDVIDSNFIQSQTIARHVLPLAGQTLSQYRVW